MAEPGIKPGSVHVRGKVIIRYLRFDFHSFASELALGKSKRLCMAHWTCNLPQHKNVMH